MVLTKMNIECSKFVKSNNPTKTTGSGHTILIHLKLIAFLLKLNSPSGKKTKTPPAPMCVTDPFYPTPVLSHMTGLKSEERTLMRN